MGSSSCRMLRWRRFHPSVWSTVRTEARPPTKAACSTESPESVDRMVVGLVMSFIARALYWGAWNGISPYPTLGYKIYTRMPLSSPRQTTLHPCPIPRPNAGVQHASAASTLPFPNPNTQAKAGPEHPAMQPLLGTAPAHT